MRLLKSLALTMLASTSIIWSMDAQWPGPKDIEGMDEVGAVTQRQRGVSEDATHHRKPSNLAASVADLRVSEGSSDEEDDGGDQFAGDGMVPTKSALFGPDDVEAQDPVEKAIENLLGVLAYVENVALQLRLQGICDLLKADAPDISGAISALKALNGESEVDPIMLDDICTALEASASAATATKHGVAAGEGEEDSEEEGDDEDSKPRARDSEGSDDE